MNWIPVEIGADCLDVELIAEILCEYIDASDFTEDMLNEIYSNCKIGNFLFLRARLYDVSMKRRTATRGRTSWTKSSTAKQN